jgi:hypothetical protein
VWRRRRQWYDGVGRCAAFGSGPCTWLVTTTMMGLFAFWKYGVLLNYGAILYFHLFLESFVIGFANKFHRLLSKKNTHVKYMHACYNTWLNLAIDLLRGVSFVSSAFN